MNNAFIEEMADLSPKNIVYFSYADHCFDETDRKIYTIFEAYLHENQESDDEDLLYCWYYCMHRENKGKFVSSNLEKFYKLYQNETDSLTKEQKALFLYRMAIHIRFYFLSSLEKEGIIMALTEDDLFALKRIQSEIKMGHEKTLTKQLTQKLTDLLVSESYFPFLQKENKEWFAHFFPVKSKEQVEFEFTLRSFCHMCYWHYQSKQDMSYVVKKGPFSFLTKHLAKVK